MQPESTEFLNTIKQYFKSAFSVDCVIFGFDGTDLKVLLRVSGMEPFKGKWSLIGDLVKEDEDLDEAAGRILYTRTGLDNVFLEQVRTFGRVNRHPLGRVVTIAYYSLVRIDKCFIQKDKEGKKSAIWHSINDIEELAYDHNEILKACHERLKDHVTTHPIGFELLPEKFTLSELQALYEAVLVKKLDKRNFRKKILSTNFLVDLKELQSGVAHRPAKLFKFDRSSF